MAEELTQPLVSSEPLVSQRTAAAIHARQISSLWSSGINLSKSVLGVGILALPYVTSQLGVGTALIFIAFLAILSSLSVHYVTIAAVRSNQPVLEAPGFRYSDITKTYCGLGAQVLLDLALIINSAGVLIVSFIIIADLLVGSGPSSPGLFSEVCGDRFVVIGVVTLLLIVPLVSTTRMRYTAGASLLGVVAILAWSIITVFLFVIAMTNKELKHVYWWPHGTLLHHGFKSAVELMSVLPVLLVAFTCQQSLQYIMLDMEYVSERQVDAVSGAALGLSTAVFSVTSVCNYALFGSGVETDILRNYTVASMEPLVWTRLAQAVFIAVRLIFLLSLLASFPLHMSALRDATWKLFFRQNLQGPGLWLVTYALLAALYFVGTFITDIWQPLVIIGSTAGVVVAFIIPGCLALKVGDAASLDTSSSSVSASQGARMAGGVLLITVGIVIAVFGVLHFILYAS